MPSPFKPVQVFKPDAVSAPNPNVASGLSIGADGNPLVHGAPPVAPPPQNVQTANALMGPLVAPTASGGTVVHPSIVSAYTKPAPTPNTPPPSQPEGLASLTPGSYPSPNGGTVSTMGGTISGYTPGGSFSIDPTGAVPSSAFSSRADPYSTYRSQQDFVNAVAQANGYSPSYLAAQSNVYGAQAEGAQLGVNNAAYANQAYGANQANNGNGLNYGSLGGATSDYVAGTIGSEQSQNAIRQSLNTQRQTQATIDLNTQQLARTGNIAAAQAQLQYSPTSVANQNAQAQYNALQQQYPNAGIPPFNPNGNALEQQQLAQSLVAASPAYQAGFTSTYTNAQGGTDILNRLTLGNLKQNADGTYQLVNGADAAIGQANKNIVEKQADIYSNIGSALTSFQKTAASTIGLMNTHGLNQSGLPILTQLQNATAAQLPNKAAAIAAFKVDVSNLQNDYATFLTARDGSVAGTNDKAAKTIDISTLSPAQLQTVISEMTTDGANTQSGALSQIQAATQGLRTNTAASSIHSGSTGAIGTSWDNL